MNAWQVMQQIRHRILALTWSGGDRVIGACCISAKSADLWLPQGVTLPAVVISPDGDSSDDEEPDWIRQRIRATLIVSAQGDGMGESSLMGAARTTDTGADGRGLDEIEPEVRAVLTALGNNGVRSWLGRRGSARATTLKGAGWVVLREMSLEAGCTADRTYAAATRLAASGGSGSVSLSWRLPADRFDRYSMVLRRASGSTAPASPTAGDGVTLASLLATSVTDAPGSGTWSYALFAAYDDYPATSGGPAWLEQGTPAEARSYSPAATVTVTA